MSNPFESPGRILVLGDESKSALTIKRQLEAAGCKAVVADAVKAALKEVSAGQFSLVIIDPAASRVTISLTPTHEDEPSTSIRKLSWAQEALDFCRAIRKQPTTAELPIVIISKNSLAQDKIAWLNAGATAYLTKPYPKGEFISRVRALLKAWLQGKEKSEKFEQVKLLHAVSTALASSLDPDVLLRGTLDVLIKGFGAEAGAIYLRCPDDQAMCVVATAGFAEQEENEGALLDLYFRVNHQLGDAPLRLESLPELSRVTLAAQSDEQIQSGMCAPLGIKGNHSGAIAIFSHNAEAFLTPNAELFSTICNQLSVALENARLYTETKKSASQLSFVYNLGNNLMTSFELDELLSYAVFSVGKSLECDACAVIVKNYDGDGTLASAQYTRQPSNHQYARAWYDEEVVRQYLSNARQNLQHSIEMRVVNRLLLDKEIALETIAPLAFDDALLGLIVCGSRNPRSLTLENQKLLGSVAHQLSLAIRNIELYQRTKDTSITLAVEVAERTKEIEEQKRFTEKIIDSLPVSLYVVDRDMRIVAWNRSREVGGGLHREDVLHKNVFRVLQKQPRGKIQEEFMEVFRSGRIVRFEEESFDEGAKKIWKISKIPMRVDNAEVSHIITVGEDVTEQKKMTEAVIHAEKLASIGRLAAGVVHEINNPLATIAACAEALLSRVAEIEQQEVQLDYQDYLKIIKDEAFRCKTITNNLLEFSHQRQADKLLGDINQILDQTLLLLKHHPKIGKMKITREVEQTLSPVLVNEGQMKQIFIALISNAYDAMEGSGELTIRTRWHQPEMERAVCAEFTDNGCGISPSNLSKIFDPFFTTKPIGRGTGLGLSVCYGIVTDHGGKIEVDSVEGQGSTFRILLPAAETAPLGEPPLHYLVPPEETERIPERRP